MGAKGVSNTSSSRKLLIGGGERAWLGLTAGWRVTKLYSNILGLSTLGALRFSEILNHHWQSALRAGGPAVQFMLMDVT
jgi:cellobiose phosphorylase